MNTAGVTVQRMVIEGTPFTEIAKVARTEQIDLVVMGTYGGRAERMEKIFFGSTAEKVVRTVGCAVLTIPLPVRKSCN